ncbi:MAG: dehydrosqualene desaturase [Acetobacterium sp. MES1]|uniref:phytoene desaturase family protein n=1 Tax=Acetobacterium sp. MES1 TaxID=1899015 RepID=UPI000B9CDAAE|nr:phytoene desaturase family protein [Acetobacterium sp. MES1]OXS27104.1 MAG: dehydrosqualene desaturase [Acetobacterium sp. MES1]
MSRKKIIVIGAGVSGLASALRLLNEGFEVELYEKNDQVGGRMGVISGEGFTFDLGPTILMMPQIYNEVFSVCGRNPADYLQMERLDPIYKVYFDDGTTHEASSELSSLIKTLESVGEAETQGYLAYLADVYQRYLVAKEHFIERSFRSASDFYNPKTLLAGLRLRTFDNAFDSVGKFVKDQKLKELLSFQTLYIGISPFNGPSIYTIIPMIELTYGVWFLKGGMRAMAQAMEKLFLEMGGKLVLNAPVERINCDGNRVRSITVAGQEQTADAVVCSADFPYAMKALLPDDFKHKKYQPDKVEALDYSCSAYMLYLGLDKRDFPDLNVHNLVFSQNFKGNLDDIFAGRFPADPSIYVYAPALLDESLAPPGQLGLYVLVPVPNLKDGPLDWNDQQVVAGYRQQAMDKIRQIKPLADFEAHIIFEKNYTPLDFRDDFNALFGATFGLRPTLLQSNYWRPQPKAMKYQNLYFTGSSAHPGAGVPIVLTSAKITVAEVVRDLK